MISKGGIGEPSGYLVATNPAEEEKLAEYHSRTEATSDPRIVKYD